MHLITEKYLCREAPRCTKVLSGIYPARGSGRHKQCTWNSSLPAWLRMYCMVTTHCIGLHGLMRTPRPQLHQACHWVCECALASSLRAPFMRASYFGLRCCACKSRIFASFAAIWACFRRSPKMGKFGPKNTKNEFPKKCSWAFGKANEAYLGHFRPVLIVQPIQKPGSRVGVEHKPELERGVD